MGEGKQNLKQIAQDVKTQAVNETKCNWKLTKNTLKIHQTNN